MTAKGTITDQTTLPNRTVALATLGVVFASVCFGIVPYFARSLTDAGIAAHAVAFYRYLLAGSLLLPLVWRWRHQRSALAWGFGAGVIMALGWVGYVRALETVPVSTAGVLYMTYPAFTLVIAWALFGERPLRRAVVSSVLIVCAAALVANPASVAPAQTLALVMSLAAPLGFGLGIAVLVHKLTKVPALVRVAVVSLGSLLGLAPLIVATPASGLFPADMAGWALVLGIGLGTALIPQLVYTVCSPIVGTARTAMAGAIELPVMFLVGWWAFAESLTVQQMAACALILLAIVLTPSKRSRSVAATVSPGDQKALRS